MATSVEAGMRVVDPSRFLSLLVHISSGISASEEPFYLSQ